MTGGDRDGVKNLARQTDDEIVFANAQQWFEHYSQCISRASLALAQPAPLHVSQTSSGRAF